MSYGITIFKLFLLSVPFAFLGAIFAPALPILSFGTTALIWGTSLIFGFLTMVYAYNGDEESKKVQKFILIGKIVFLIVCTFSIGCVINLNLPGKTNIFFIAPLALIAAKTFWGMNITEYFDS